MSQRTVYEVFHPLNGVTLYTTRYRLVAAFIAWYLRLDYNVQGKGW